MSTTLHLPSDHPAQANAPSGRVETEPAAILHPEAPLYPDGESRESERVSVSGEGDPTPDGTREAPYVGRGVIRGIRDGQLEIEHEAIPGFMAAMTMAFPVAEGTISDTWKVGDEIVFKIENHPEHGYQVFSVEAAIPQP